MFILIGFFFLSVFTSRTLPRQWVAKLSGRVRDEHVSEAKMNICWERHSLDHAVSSFSAVLSSSKISVPQPWAFGCAEIYDAEIHVYVLRSHPDQMISGAIWWGTVRDLVYVYVYMSACKCCMYVCIYTIHNIVLCQFSQYNTFFQWPRRAVKAAHVIAELFILLWCNRQDSKHKYEKS